MRRRLTRALILLAALACLLAANWILGGPASENALRAFDQRLIDAFFGQRAGVPVPQVNGFTVLRRLPLPAVSYYEGQSLVRGREISCAERRSVVLWYGVGAVLLWQDGLWLPDRESTARRYAETGHVH